MLFFLGGLVILKAIFIYFNIYLQQKPLSASTHHTDEAGGFCCSPAFCSFARLLTDCFLCLKKKKQNTIFQSLPCFLRNPEEPLVPREHIKQHDKALQYLQWSPKSIPKFSLFPTLLLIPFILLNYYMENFRGTNKRDDGLK